MDTNEIRSILEHESSAILNIPISDAYSRAIDLIVEQVNQKRQACDKRHGQSRTDSTEHCHYIQPLPEHRLYFYIQGRLNMEI